MKVRFPPRLLGLLILAASGGTTLIHRWQYEASRAGPPQLAEFGLALATFMLASTGMLMLIHGARLFERDPELRACRKARSKLDALDNHAPRRDKADMSRAAAIMQARRVFTAGSCEQGRARKAEAAHKPHNHGKHPAR